MRNASCLEIPENPVNLNWRQRIVELISFFINNSPHPAIQACKELTNRRTPFAHASCWAEIHSDEQNCGAFISRMTGETSRTPMFVLTTIFSLLEFTDRTRYRIRTERPHRVGGALAANKPTYALKCAEVVTDRVQKLNPY
jgi:hypothetical protein